MACASRVWLKSDDCGDENSEWRSEEAKASSPLGRVHAVAIRGRVRRIRCRHGHPHADLDARHPDVAVARAPAGVMVETSQPTWSMRAGPDPSQHLVCLDAEA